MRLPLSNDPFASLHPSGCVRTNSGGRNMVMHTCEEYLSQCCGAERHEYVVYFCNACGEASGFECPDCGKIQEGE